MLGNFYARRQPLEIFLCTMTPGKHSSQLIRERYAFISDLDFLKILQYCNNQDIIDIDIKDNSISFDSSVYDVISFIKKTNLVISLQNMQKDFDHYVVNQCLMRYLKEIDFYENKNKYQLNYGNNPKSNCVFKIKNILNDCMIVEYHHDYSRAISKLNIFLYSERRGDEDE